MVRRSTLLAAGCVTCLLAGGRSRAARASDWPQFNFDAAHRGWNTLESAIDAGNVGTLHVLYSVQLPDTVDGAPALLAAVPTPLGVRDLLFVTTKDGRLLALDAASGGQVWAQHPASGPRYTTSSPAVDPNRVFVYSYGLDGRVHKFRVGDGTEITSGGWPQLATLKPDVEKGSSALSVATVSGGASYLYVANGGYPGDAGDYQGHVTAINLATGQQQVWNAACSDQPVHFTEGGSPDCTHVQTAIWARAGAVYDADNNRLFVTSSNGDFDASTGGHDWGDSVLALHPDATGSGASPVDSYTPASFLQLEQHDLDLGSTTVALIPALDRGTVPHLGVQSGKDALVRLLNLDDLSGQGGPGHLRGEIQVLGVPQGGEVLTAPAIWINPADGSRWVFLANGNGISGLEVQSSSGGPPSLIVRWTQTAGGTSPIIAGNVLFYASFGGVRGLDPVTGHELWSDSSPRGLHWESPIVINGRLYVTDENQTLWAYGLTAAAPCATDPATLCLGANHRFQLSATWRTGAGSSQAQAVQLTPDTGYFWFFGPNNLEAVLKVLDGCATNGHFWVFGGGLTNVRTMITVIDTLTGQARTYNNPQGHPFTPIQDTSAFPCS